MRRLMNMLRDRKGQGLTEYALLLAGIALVSIVGISLVGEKTGDMIDLVAAILPGADADDNGPIGQGHLIETTAASGQIQLDDTTISGSKTARLGVNLTGQSVSGDGGTGLIVDAVTQGGS